MCLYRIKNDGVPATGLQSYARENMIIPLFLNANNLTLAVSNPCHIVKMHELMAIYSHLSMNCVLITEEKFDQLYAMLYGEMFKVSGEKTRGNQPQLFREDSKWVMTEPLSQGWLISNLFGCYQTLCEKNGKTVSNDQKDLFTEFIQKNFDLICKDYNCRSVAFWFEVENSLPELKASPVMKEAEDGQS